MTAGVRQLLGLAVASVSFLCSVIICALPQWRVTKTQDPRSYYIQGLWRFCAAYGMNLAHCVRYEMVNASITQDLKGARVLIVIAIIVGFTGILLGVAGSKFINFVSDERKKSKMAMASGVIFLIAGLFVLIPVCWTTSTISVNFDNHLPSGSPDFSGFPGSSGTLKSELGASVYIGWITSGLWFLGGGLLCSSFPLSTPILSKCGFTYLN